MRLPSLPATPVFLRTLLGGIACMSVCVMLATATTCHAQTIQTTQTSEPTQAVPKRWDVAITFDAQRSLRVNTGENFWMQGGSAELGMDFRRGWGLAADLTGAHTGFTGTDGIPLSLISGTVGPRYRWTGKRRVSLYGQGLIGLAHGFDSLFPGQTQSQSSANSFAFQLSGGADYPLTPRFGLRLIDAGWLRTQLPNGGNDTQNTLRLGAGATFRF